MSGRRKLRDQWADIPVLNASTYNLRLQIRAFALQHAVGAAAARSNMP